MLTKAAREAKKLKLEELATKGLLLVNRVDIYNVKQKDPNFLVCDEACDAARAFYNSLNYYCREQWNQGKFPPSYLVLEAMVKAPPEELEHWLYHYQRLPVQTAQQVIIALRNDWDNFFKAKKAYKLDPSRFLGEPQPPKYKFRRAEVCIPQNFSISKTGYLRFFKELGFQPLKLHTKYDSDHIKQVKIIPQATCYQVIVVYEETIIKEPHYDLANNFRRILGIDLGINNFLACVNNVGLMPFVINGRGMKALNQLYNKVKAKQQSLLPFFITKGNKRKQRKWSKLLGVLTENRSQTLKDLLHKISCFIVDYCQHHQINTVVAGYNSFWKQEVEMGKRTNQNFSYLPHRKFLDVLKYKLHQAGIEYREVSEEYTSKCSFLDNEPVQKHEKYSGKRVKRGMFRSSQGILINADLNGAYNIVRKVFPGAFDVFKGEGRRGCGLHPIKLSNLFQLTFQETKGVSVPRVLKKCNTFIQINKNV